MAAVTICSDFGCREKSVTVSIFSPSICYEVMGLDAMILVFWMWSFCIRIPLSTFSSRLFFFKETHILKILIYFWPCWVLVAVQAFSSCGKWGILSSGAWASHCGGMACGVFQDLGSNQGSLHWQEKFFTTGPPGKSLDCSLKHYSKSVCDIC